jgi:hypothetical protein
METTRPMPEHLPGFEIRTKHKEAIRQLHKFAKIPIESLMARYSLSKTSIIQVLAYDRPERARIGRTGRPYLLNDAQVDQIIEYLSDSWEHRVLNYGLLHDELKLECSVKTLERRLKQRGYYRCTACQKPYLTMAQVTTRLL